MPSGSRMTMQDIFPFPTNDEAMLFAPSASAAFAMFTSSCNRTPPNMSRVEGEDFLSTRQM